LGILSPAPDMKRYGAVKTLDPEWLRTGNRNLLVAEIGYRAYRRNLKKILGDFTISRAWSVIGWLATGVMAIASIVFMISLLLPGA
jgi:hypothetical protein